MQTLLIAFIAYVILFPLMIFIIARLHRLFFITLKVRRARKKKQKIDYSELPKPLGPRMGKRVRFAIKDKRGFALRPKKPTKIQTRWIFFALYLAGLGFAITAVMRGSFTLVLCSLGFGLIALGFALQSADKAIKKRNDITERIATMAGSHFKIKMKPEDPPTKIVKIDNWAEYTRPTNVRVFAGRAFEPNAQKSFMEEFNRTYGRIRSWVADPDAPETDGTGWDHEAGIVYLKSKPPLPTNVGWHEDYVLNEGIAWSFFPLAIGLEDGVEMPNPETGETVNVLGFDVAGEQKSVGQKAGLKVSSKVSMTPQAFIGGSTGGGKAHPVDTEVVVLNG